MYCEALRLGFKPGQELTAQRVAELGITHLWGDGGLMMEIHDDATEGDHVRFRVMTREELRAYRASANSPVSDRSFP